MPIQIIADPTFATLGQPQSPWQCLAHEGTTFTGAREGDAVRLDVSSAKGANWHGELRYAPFPVRAGQKATIRFSAKAVTPIRFSVWIGQADSPWASVVTEQTHFGEQEMTREWTSFEHRADIAIDDEEARLCFVLGVVDNTIWIRGVSLTIET